jgi:YgiT-type zinc finger domain-containing protein
MANDLGCQEVFACQFCGATTRQELVKAVFWGERGWVAIEDIPARVCVTCGEQFYDQATAQRIHQLVASPPQKPKRQVLVPLFSLADAMEGSPLRHRGHED